MAEAKIDIEVHVVKELHNGFADLAAKLAVENGIHIENVQFEWLYAPSLSSPAQRYLSSVTLTTRKSL